MSQSRRKKGSRRYRDNADHDSEAYTDTPADDKDENSEDSDEEEIEILHVRESAKQRLRRDLRQAAAKPSTRTLCWRWFLFLVVVSIGIAMIVNLYASYGEFLTDQLFLLAEQRRAGVQQRDPDQRLPARVDQVRTPRQHVRARRVGAFERHAAERRAAVGVASHRTGLQLAAATHERALEEQKHPARVVAVPNPQPRRLRQRSRTQYVIRHTFYFTCFVLYHPRYLGGSAGFGMLMVVVKFPRR